MSTWCLGLLFLVPCQDPPVPDLVEHLRADSPEVRHHAFTRLRTLSRTAEPELRTAAKDPDSEVAARTSTLLRSLELRRSLSPRILREFPALPERAAVDPAAWHAALDEALEFRTERRLRHPDLKESDLETLAILALGQATTPSQFQSVFWAIESRQLRGALPAVRSLFDHPSNQVRLLALQLLQHFRDRDSVLPIAGLLEDPMLRNQASWLLAHFGRASVVPAVRPYLEHPESEVRAAAMRALRDVDSRVATPLLRLRLSDPDREIRIQAMQLLVRHGGARGALPDLQPFLEGEDPELQLAALSALQGRSAPEVWPSLRRLLRSENSDVRNQTIEVILDAPFPDAKDDLLELLQDPSPQVRILAARSLATLGLRETIPPLLQLLTDPSEYVRDEGLRSLCALEYRDILPLFIDRLRDPDAQTRGWALSWLDERPWPQAAPEVARLLDDPESKIRVAAIQSLQKLGNPSVAVRLLPFLLKPRDPEAEAALKALCQWRIPELHRRLIDLASHEDADVRRLALDILAWHGVTEAAPVFLKGLDDPDECVRDEAIQGVARLKLREAIPALRALLNDPARKNCLPAALALCDLKDWESLGDMKTMLTAGEDLHLLIGHLENLNEPGLIPPLEPLMDSNDRRVARGVLALFREMNHPLATEACRRVMRIDGHLLQISAIIILGDREDQESVPELIRLLDDSSVNLRNVAADALAKIGDRDAIPALMRKLLEDGPGDRKGILVALSRLGAPDLSAQVLKNLRSDRADLVEEALDAAVVLRMKAALPDLVRLSQDDDLFLRPLASTALLRLGDRGEIPLFLQRNCRDVHLLNAFRRPDLCERLQTTPQPRTYDGTCGQVLEAIAADAGLVLEVFADTAILERPVYGRLHRRNGRSTLLDALVTLFDERSVSFILEPDRIQVLGLNDADAFWKHWGKQQGFK